MSEYYIPDISELYVGFKYQSMCIENAHWGICKVEEDFATPPYLYEIENETIRVKYLDRDDIESLEWTLKQSISKNRFIYQNNNDNFLRLSITYKEEPLVSVYHYGGWETPDLLIKNKSELKKLFKQLNIL